MSINNLENIYKLLANLNFDMNKNVPDEFKCVKCRKILIEACQIQCGCRFCRSCVDEMINNGCQFCPGITSDCEIELLSSFVIDYRANKQISKLIMKCPMKMCSYQCEILEMSEHLRICENNSVECSYCKLGCETMKMTIETFTEHFQNDNLDHNQTLIEKMRENELKYNEEINKLKTNLHSTDEKLKSIYEEIAALKMKNLKIENRLKNVDDIFNDEIVKLKAENEKEMKLIKNENKKLDDKMQIELRNTWHKIDEIELKLMKQDENRKIESLKSEIIEKVELLQGNFDNKIDEIKSINESETKNTKCELAAMKMKNLMIENRLKNVDDIFNDEIVKLKVENEKEMKLIKNENEKLDDKMQIELRNTWHKIDEIELKLMKQDENRKIKSLKSEIIEKVELLQGNFDNKIDEIKLINGESRFEIMGVCRKTIDESIMQIVIEQEINQLEINSENEVKGILEMIVTNFDKMKNRFIWSEYFFFRFRPYILRLHIYSSIDDELWICLYIYDDVINQYLCFPFKADVTIKIINKNKREVSKIITKYCQIEKPKKNSFSRSEEFIYPISELTENGVLESNCFIVECCVELK